MAPCSPAHLPARLCSRRGGERRAQVVACVCGHRLGRHRGRSVPGGGGAALALLGGSAWAQGAVAITFFFLPSCPSVCLPIPPQSYSFNYMGQKLGRRVRVLTFRALLRQVRRVRGLRCAWRRCRPTCSAAPTPPPTPQPPLPPTPIPTSSPSLPDPHRRWDGTTKTATPLACSPPSCRQMPWPSRASLETPWGCSRRHAGAGCAGRQVRQRCCSHVPMPLAAATLQHSSQKPRQTPICTEPGDFWRRHRDCLHQRLEDDVGGVGLPAARHGLSGHSLPNNDAVCRQGVCVCVGGRVGRVCKAQVVGPEQRQGRGLGQREAVARRRARPVTPTTGGRGVCTGQPDGVRGGWQHPHHRCFRHGRAGAACWLCHAGRCAVGAATHRPEHTPQFPTMPHTPHASHALAQVTQLYGDKLDKPTKEAQRRSNAAGLGFGFSQFVMMGVWRSLGLQHLILPSGGGPGPCARRDALHPGPSYPAPQPSIRLPSGTRASSWAAGRTRLKTCSR